MTELCIIIFFLTKLVMTSTYKDSTVQCYKHPDRDNINVIQGEALHCPCANNDCSQETNHTMISWFKNGSDGIQKITTDESARVHHHGPDLYILPLTVNDTGLYITRWWETEENCNEYEIHIEVSEEFHTDRLYSNSSEEPANVWITCPVCEHQDKTLIWYKDLHLIPGRSEEHLHISNFSKKDEGIYTCLCTWEHNGRKYNTSGSRQLHITEPSTNFPTTILYPNNMSVEFVDLGSKVELNCSAFFGFNVRDQCSVLWFRNDTQLDGVEGYTVYERKETETFHSFLTIHKVSEMDLQSEFHCKAISPYKWMYVIITLKSRESVLPLVVMFLCIFLIMLLAAGTTKWYAVDLALFFRGLGLVQNKRNDGKIYDAYVIYQKDNMDEKMKKKLAHFINRVLPAILENRCGFKLYIHGRDDLPGEDCIGLTEMRMQLSRRLIVVLTPGFSQEQDLMTPAQGYDWQVGLHQVLVQQETSMILIQLGDIKDYSHLPLGLQHLLQKSPPLKWNEGSRQAASPSSHFWKQVRYMMPVIPAQQWGPNLGSPQFHFQQYSDTCVLKMHSP